MDKPSFTIGCDPEFFLRDCNSGRLISAIPHVEGTKHEPKSLPRGGNIQRDNVAVEIATDPADSCEMFVGNIEKTLTEAVKTLPPETEIIALPSACFDADQLDHPEAQAFGCDPDYDVWELAQNEPPVASDASFRSCGAHIHVGTNGSDGNEFLLDFEGKFKVVKMMDCIHGIISTVLDAGKEALDRRKLYGKPGAHRPKDYGVEYRVLSNYWLKSPVTVMMMYYLTQDVLDIVRDGREADFIAAMEPDRVKNTIMTGDVKTAEKLIDEHVLPILSDDSVHYYNEALAKVRGDDMHFHMEWKLYGKEKAA
jgi:hypothetical protein